MLVLPLGSLAQSVPRALVLEHFTNSVCSICANRNPSLHQNLQQNAHVLALSIHPSSPYASCFLSQNNTIANDNRTNFYGIYGGTPRIVINGVVQAPGVAFGSAQVFQPFMGQFSAFAVATTISLQDGDLHTRTVLRKSDASVLDSLWLFYGLAQDTVWFNGGNGEAAHYRVVRRALQQRVLLPQAIGDSVVITHVWPTHSSWDLNRMFHFALLQDESRALEQADFSELLEPGAVSVVDRHRERALVFFPNPVRDMLHFSGTDLLHYEIFDLYGRKIRTGTLTPGDGINVQLLPASLYLLRDLSTSATYRVLVR